MNTEKAYYGQYGGRYVPEMLIPVLDELEEAFEAAKSDPVFQAELEDLYQNYSGRPTPLYYCANLSQSLDGAKIYLKNEGLNHTGAHKVNHCLGQVLLAKKLGKKKIIAETGAGQHGVATATVAAKFGLECEIFMGEVDFLRQRPNVFWMEKLGAKVTPVTTGQRRLKDAVNAAIRSWIAHPDTSHFLLGSALGPHPYPALNRYFQEIVGREVKEQILKAEGRLPDTVVACVGGGSNSIGIFSAFLDDAEVALIGVEAGGKSFKIGEHASRFEGGGKLGVIEGYKSLFLQDEDGNSLPTHSVSAGLDYIGVGPEHAYLNEISRVTYTSATDKEALNAFNTLAKKEGIISALESAHAVAEALKRAPKMSKEEILVINLSGRGDKDIFIIADALRDEAWQEFILSSGEKYQSPATSDL